MVTEFVQTIVKFPCCDLTTQFICLKGKVDKRKIAEVHLTRETKSSRDGIRFTEDFIWEFYERSVKVNCLFNCSYAFTFYTRHKEHWFMCPIIKRCFCSWFLGVQT